MVIECVDSITNYILVTSGILVASTMAGVVWGVHAVKKSKKIEGLLEGLSYKIPDLGLHIDALSGKKIKKKEAKPEHGPEVTRTDPDVESQTAYNYVDKFETISQNMDKMRKALILHKNNIAMLSTTVSKQESDIKSTSTVAADLQKEVQRMKSVTGKAIHELYSLMDLASNPALEPDQISNSIRSKLQSSSHYDTGDL